MQEIYNSKDMTKNIKKGLLGVSEIVKESTNMFTN